MFAVYYDIETVCGYPDIDAVATFDNRRDAQKFLSELYNTKRLTEFLFI